MWVKIGICDDSQCDRERLKDILKEYFLKSEERFEIIEYASGEVFLEGQDVNILFLDIEMDVMDGIRVKNRLQEMQSETKILFTTSHQEMMRDAFGKQVFGFLKKPVQSKEVEECLRTVLADMENQSAILIDGINGKKYISEKNILYIEAEAKYCRIMLENQDTIFSDKSIGVWLEELENRGFCLCHRSYLVNLYHIRRIEEEILLMSGEKVPVSRRMKTKVKEAYKEYIRKNAR